MAEMLVELIQKFIDGSEATLNSLFKSSFPVSISVTLYLPLVCHIILLDQRGHAV